MGAPGKSNPASSGTPMIQTTLLPETEGGLQCIVSGGQTGVDRAALEAALAAGLSCGGWCPRGRKAEDGPIASRYPLQETPSDAYEQRTRWNVRDSDGTLVLTEGEPLGGTALTIQVAREWGRPLLIVDLNAQPASAVIDNWLMVNRIRVLNVAGPRESQIPGIQGRASTFLEKLLDKTRRPGT
jgi:predicted Rossmann fold nucleotide-binding protein DprA/Smf involved in DNA uptake